MTKVFWVGVWFMSAIFTCTELKVLHDYGMKDFGKKIVEGTDKPKQRRATA